MNFKEAKQKVIESLVKGDFSHEVRNNIDVKNLLSTGDVSKDEVAEIIGRSRGNQYSSSPHHYDDSVPVHVLVTHKSGKDWYIKWYFKNPDSVFISVHN